MYSVGGTIAVTMTVTPPASWGKITGTATVTPGGTTTLDITLTPAQTCP